MLCSRVAESRSWAQMTKKIVSVLNRIEEVALVGMFAVMVGIIFVQVIMRYIFNNSLSWSEELGKFLFVWISWIGISIGARRGEHIKITMFVDKFGHKGQHIANIISEIIVIGICGVTTYYGVILVVNQAPVHYAGIKISMSWGYLAVALGCLLMMIRSVLSILKSAKALKEGPSQITPLEGGDF